MKKHILAVTMVIAIVIILNAEVYPVSVYAKEDANKEGPQQVSGIETCRASRMDFKLTINFYGRVESKKVVELRAPVSGRIISFMKTDEEVVKKGEILYVIGGPEIERRLRALNLEVLQLKGLLSELQGMLKTKEMALQKNLISINEFESVKLKLIKTQMDYDEAMLRVHQLQSSLKVRAPIQGRFVRRRFSEGQDVHGGDIVGYIVDTQHLRVTALIFPPGDREELKGKKAVIYTRDGLSVHGTVKKVLTERTLSGGVRVWIGHLSRILCLGIEFSVKYLSQLVGIGLKYRHRIPPSTLYQPFPL